MTDLALNNDGTVTLYNKGKKVMKGTLEEVVAHLRGPEAPTPTRKPKKERPKSRGARWADAAGAATAALTDLQDIQQEFEEWKDNLPENLQQSALGEKLEAVCNIDISSALEAAEEAESADLPLGFGRD